MNVAEDVGLRFRHDPGGSGKKYFVEIMGSGGGLLDYDNDGWLDVYLCNGAPLPGHQGGNQMFGNKLFHNDHGKSFDDVTASAGVGGFVNGRKRYSMGICVADYNNDGFVDLFVTNWGSNILYRNNGDGTFADATAEAGIGGSGYSSSATFLDYDLDGDPDLFVVHYVEYLIGEDITCWSQHGGHREKDFCLPTVYRGEPDHLYRNNGDGTFTDITRQAGIRDAHRGLGVAVCDYDNDGDLDIYVANDLDPNDLWRNNGNGTFINVALEAGVAYGEGGKAQAGMGTDWGDFDNDGDFDLIVGNFSQDYNTLYENLGRGILRDSTEAHGLALLHFPYVTFGLGFFDADSDGRPDLFFVNGHVIENVEDAGTTFRQRNLLCANKGNSFVNVSDQAGPALKLRNVGRGAAFGDYDNDGDVDVLVTNWNDPPLLLRNDYRDNAHWMLLELEGLHCGSTPLGTRVGVVSDGHRALAEVRGATSYCSQNDLRLHFGLGGADRIEYLSIRWPCGRHDEWRGLPANKCYRVRETSHSAHLAPSRL